MTLAPSACSIPRASADSSGGFSVEALLLKLKVKVFNMPTFSGLRTFKCPSCNATLAANDQDRSLKCQYCGTIVEVPAAEPAAPAPPQVVSLPPVFIQANAPPVKARQSSRLGCVVALIVMVSIGIGVVSLLGGLAPIVVLMGLPTFAPNLLPPNVRVQDVLVLPAVNDGPPEVLASTYDYQKQADALTYLDLKTPSARWNSPALSSTVFNSLLYVTDDERLYLADETRLITLNRADGQPAWQATLSDKFYSACEDCLQLRQGQVVALTDDGELQAFEAKTGRPSWQVRLTETPRRLFGLGDDVAVVDKEGEAVVLKVFDAQSGKLMHQIEPTGKNEPFPSDPQTLDLYAPVLADPDGASLYFFIGFFPPYTIQRWNVVANKQLWEATLDDDQASLSSSVKPVLTNGAIYFPNGRYEKDAALIAVDAKDGAVRSLPLPDPDYQLGPLAEQGGVLVVSARRTRGTERYEVWGLNAQTGKVLWKHQPQAAQLADDVFNQLELSLHLDDGATATPSSSDRGKWGWRLVGNRLILLEALSNQLIVEQLSLTDGKSSEPIALAPRWSDSRTSFVDIEVRHFTTRQAWLTVEGSLQVFNLETGALQASWP